MLSFYLAPIQKEKVQNQLVIHSAEGEVAALGKGFTLITCWSKWFWVCLAAWCEQRVREHSGCSQPEEKPGEVWGPQQRGTNATARFQEATGRLSNEQSSALLGQVKDRQVKGSQWWGISPAPVPSWGPVHQEKLEPSIESVKQELPYIALPSLPSPVQTQKSKLASGGEKWQMKKRPISRSYLDGSSLISQLVKNLPVMQEIPVQFLGWKDPLEKG